MAASVVIPCRNRRELLRSLLDALDGQTQTDFETIVVDDGSTDGADMVAATAVVAGRPVRLLRSNGAGAVAARNIGVTAARAPVIAFTDSDCVPCPVWMAEGLRAIEDGADLVNGRTQPERPLRPRERSVASGTEGLYPTCNMFYRRSVLEEAGGFDTADVARLRFRLGALARGTGFGEDTLLAWRARRNGAVAAYRPQALVLHHVFPPDWRDLLSRCGQVAAFPALVRQVPEIRPTMVRRGVLFGPRSRVPVYLVGFLLLARHPRPASLAALWWALLRLHELRAAPVSWPRRVAAVPGELAVDASMGLAFIVGSIRSRTPIL